MKETIYLLIFLFLLLIFHDLCMNIKEGMTTAEKCENEAKLLNKANLKIKEMERQIRKLEYEN